MDFFEPKDILVIGRRIQSTTLILIFANLITLIGVLIFGWNAASILLLYLAETGIIGFYTIVKIMSQDKKLLSRFYRAIIFCFFYAFFIVTFYYVIITYSFEYFHISNQTLSQIKNISFEWIFIISILFGFHTYAYFLESKNSIRSQKLQPLELNEAKNITNAISQTEEKLKRKNIRQIQNEKINEPYLRLVILQLTLTFGFMGISYLSQFLLNLPDSIIVKISSFILVSIKIILEIFIPSDY